MTKWLRFFTFLTFFLKIQKHHFLRFFERLHTICTRFLEHFGVGAYVRNTLMGSVVFKTVGSFKNFL